jgi:hypothetical protein
MGVSVNNIVDSCAAGKTANLARLPRQRTNAGSISTPFSRSSAAIRSAVSARPRSAQSESASPLWGQHGAPRRRTGAAGFVDGVLGRDPLQSLHRVLNYQRKTRPTPHPLSPSIPLFATELGSKKVASCSRPVHGEGRAPDHVHADGLAKRLSSACSLARLRTASVRPTDQRRLAVRTGANDLSSHHCHKGPTKMPLSGGGQSSVELSAAVPVRHWRFRVLGPFGGSLSKTGGANGFHVRPAAS